MIRYGTGYRIFNILNISFFVLLIVLMSIPVLNVLTMSLEPDEVAIEVGRLHIFPKVFTLAAYRKVLEQASIFLAFKNSLYVTIVSAFLGTVITGMIGYAISFDELPGVRILTLMLVITMMFKGGIIPDYLLMQKLGLINNFWSVILIRLVTGYNIILMRAFFKSIPKSVTEAALIDGASHIHIFYRIILPMSKAILATILLFIAVVKWNMYFEPLLYLNSPKKQLLQVLLRKLLIESDLPETMQVDVGLNVKMAIAIVSMVPIIMVYPFLQKYFTKGIMIGSVKE